MESLLYICAYAQLGITLVVTILSQFVETPLQIHHCAAKRVLMYLVGAARHGMMIGDVPGETNGQKRSTSGLSLLSNSGCAQSTGSRSYASGRFVILRGGFVGRPSSKQRRVAVSSIESEYTALSEGIPNIQYYWHTSNEISKATGRTIVYEDNQACIWCVTEQRKRNNHIDVSYHVYREAVGNGDVRGYHCPSTEMTANTLTKPLGSEKYKIVEPLISMMFS